MRFPGPAQRLQARWRALSPRTLRMRLTAVYGGLFILCGAALLAITYVLVSGRETTEYFAGVARQAAGKVLEFQARGQAVGGHVSQSSSGVVRPPTSLPNGAAIPKALSKQFLIATGHLQSSAALGTLQLESAIALAIMTLISVWLGWLVAGRALRPLREITAAAREISASNLHRRLALEGPDDELRQLAGTFDGLLERLESAFTAQRQFAANVSHELRTPLTYERTLLEVALADPGASVEHLRAVCEQVLAAGEHQERLIEALLMLSRSQRGLDQRRPLDLAEIATQALGAVEVEALAIECELQPAPTLGDPRLLERLAVNLMRNAVQHNHRDGWVRVSTRVSGGRSILSVANSGAPLDPADLERLFEPFQRLDGARTSNSDGLGLGLSIVSAIAEAHGAETTSTPLAGGGLEIEVGFALERRPAGDVVPALAS